MRKITFIIGSFLLLWTHLMYAQVPESLSYQAVVRDAAGKLQENRPVGIRISILQGSESGTAVYRETHAATTNANGLVTLQIGKGDADLGAFASIDWAGGLYFVKTEIDPAGEAAYAVTTVSQLLSVPFALYAKTSGSSLPGPSGTAGTQGEQGPAGKSAYDLWIEDGNIGSLEDFLALYENVKPDWNASAGDRAEIQNKPALFSGNYNDLTNKPKSAYDLWYEKNGNTGSLEDFLAFYENVKPDWDALEDGKAGILNKPALFSGDYDDLTNKPKSAYDLWYEKNGNTGSLEDFLAFCENVKPDWNASEDGKAGILNKPTLFSGDYNELTNKPMHYENVKPDWNALESDDAGILNKPFNDGANKGDLLYWNGSDRWNVLPAGTNGQILSIQNGELVWIDGASKTYQPGEIFLENDMPAGVIVEISSSGQSGTMISLDEYDKTWGLKNALLNCTDPSGRINTNIIKLITGYETSYPAVAAAAAVEPGDDWYLPSKEEFDAVYNYRNRINSSLELLGKNTLSGNYWTSSEDDKDNAWQMPFNSVTGVVAGSAFTKEKDQSAKVRAMRYLNRADLESRPQDYAFYKVGDVFYESGTPTGVVYEITDGGRHGKMISLTQERKAWAYDLTTVTGAVSDTDGQANIDAILSSVEYDKNLSTYPPDFLLFSVVGDGWYLPAKDEWTAIYNEKTAINTALDLLIQKKISNVRLLEEESYWTSTENDEGTAYIISLEDAATSTLEKDTNAYLRGIKKF